MTNKLLDLSLWQILFKAILKISEIIAQTLINDCVMVLE